MKKFLFASALAAAMIMTATSWTPASAQNLEYAYGSSLELMGGWAGTPFTVTGESGKASSVAHGADFGIRYTYFFGRHFGMYGQLSFAGTSAGERNYYGAVNKADGGKYRYDPNYCYTQENSAYLPLATVGCAFRYDFGNWSLRPRVGVGVAAYNVESYGQYIKMDRNDSSAPVTYHYTNYKVPEVDFLVSDNYRRSVDCMPSFLASASLQMAYTVRRHLYFSAELGCSYMTAQIEKVNGYYDAMSAYNPESWVDAVADSDNIGIIVPDYEHPHEQSFSSRVGSLLYFNVGIGWNIGWNRNTNGWYHRR